MLKPHAPVFNSFNLTQATPTTGQPGTVLTGGAANTKASTYTTLIASLGFDATLVVIAVSNSFVSATDTSTLVDIAIGASTAETIIIPDLLAGWAGGANEDGHPRHYIFPLYIPSGSRISARCGGTQASQTVSVALQVYGGMGDGEDWWCGEQVIAYGINSGSSKGTSVTPGVSSAEGSWTSIGTTSQDHQVIVPGMQLADTNTVSNGICLDVGIDTTSTAILRENLRALTDTTERLAQMGVWWPLYNPIPSGSVLAARASVSSGTADTLDVALYGIS